MLDNGFHFLDSFQKLFSLSYFTDFPPHQSRDFQLQLNTFFSTIKTFSKKENNALNYVENVFLIQLVKLWFEVLANNLSTSIWS